MANASSKGSFFRQRVAAIALSLERSTDRVPADGYYYVLLQGDVKGKFKSKRQAEELYRKLLLESGYRPEGVDPGSPINESVERYLDDVESYWLESHRHVRRGGKGRY